MMEKKLSLVELIEILTRMVAEWEVQFFKYYEKAGLTTAMVHYIEAIHAINGPTYSELARHLNYTKPSVTGTIGKLIDLGFVYKTQQNEDRRNYHLWLTKKGEDFMAKHNDVHQRIADVFSQNLDQEDLETLIDILNRAIRKVA